MPLTMEQTKNHKLLLVFIHGFKGDDQTFQVGSSSNIKNDVTLLVITIITQVSLLIVIYYLLLDQINRNFRVGCNIL